jgi:hypothetical protein
MHSSAVGLNWGGTETTHAHEIHSYAVRLKLLCAWKK